jgi:uncharacterized membrane protein YeaQ/YmgE (transglycosylase-associated protein family)
MHTIRAQEQNKKEIIKTYEGVLIMWIILWLLFGALIGWLASLITKNSSRMGAFWNIVVGLLGALLGGLIAQWLGMGPISTFSIGGLILSLVGAVIILLIVNLFTRKK